ncbi:hypothetical protein F4823DRAFT_409585 [Ustulina deusta]|nr:hypothetical protein F4823DRAFT_409585 [Ustulina deusta]
MRFHMSTLAAAASLAALVSAVPTPTYDSVGVAHSNNNAKRVPCPASAPLSTGAAKAKRTEDEDIQEDDSPGLIIACAF